jgi:hypothetical protein
MKLTVHLQICVDLLVIRSLSKPLLRTTTKLVYKATTGIESNLDNFMDCDALFLQLLLASYLVAQEHHQGRLLSICISNPQGSQP